MPRPIDLPEDPDFLVIDGERMGSVARFVSDRGDPNVQSQTILLPGAGSALCYGVGLFALTDIAPNTVLRMHCHEADEADE